MNYYFDAKVLCKRSSNGTLLRCLDGTEEKKKHSKKFTKGFVFLDDHGKGLNRIYQ
jgi:hypothetical protein